MTETPDRLNDILCWRDERYVGQQLTFSYERKRIMLEESEVSRGLVGKYVDTYAWPDGRFKVRWKGFSLPDRIFDPDQQRVTHAAITENKHLSAALAYAKEIQDARLAGDAVKIASSGPNTHPPAASLQAPREGSRKPPTAAVPKRNLMQPNEPDRRTGQTCDIWSRRPARSCAAIRDDSSILQD